MSADGQNSQSEVLIENFRFDAEATVLGQLVERNGLTGEVVRRFEGRKDELYGLTGDDLAQCTEALGLDAGATNKDAINEFCALVFPGFRTRTLEQQADTLADIEHRMVDHFARYDVTAATTGSYSYGGPNTPTSDYDILVAAESGKEQQLLDAIDSLPTIGIFGFNTRDNGGLQGANMVVDNDNKGYGFIRALAKDGTTVEVFIIGENSFPTITQIGGRVLKLQEGKQRWSRIKEFRRPGTEHVIVEPPPESWEYTCWPQIDTDAGSVHGVNFFENLLLTAVPEVGYDPRNVLSHFQHGALQIAAHLIDYYHPVVNKLSGEIFLSVLGCSDKPNLTAPRRAQLLNRFAEAESRLLSQRSIL